MGLLYHNLAAFLHPNVKQPNMKRFNLLPVALVLVLLVGVTSCTTIGGAQDEYYEPASASGNRIYVDDPYRGTVVLQKDLRTGRYYEIGTLGSSYSGYYGSGAIDPYYGYGYRDRYYGGRSPYSRNNGGYYRNGQAPARPAPQQPSAEDRHRNEQNKGEARKKVLGN